MSLPCRRRVAFDLRSECNTIFFVVIAVASYLAGNWDIQRTASKGSASGGRTILYYVDRMHPAYKSDKPGIAPDCGMEVDQTRAGAAGKTSQHRGTTYYFCSDECKEAFDRDPARHAAKVGGRGTPQEAAGHARHPR